jgi:hypothetical protein
LPRDGFIDKEDLHDMLASLGKVSNDHSSSSATLQASCLIKGLSDLTVPPFQSKIKENIN